MIRWSEEWSEQTISLLGGRIGLNHVKDCRFVASSQPLFIRVAHIRVVSYAFEVKQIMQKQTLESRK